MPVALCLAGGGSVARWKGTWVTFTESVPWFLPGTIVSIGVALAVSGSASRALAMSRTIAAALAVSFGVIVSATLTPLRGAIESGATGTGACNLSRVGIVTLNDLMAPTALDTVLNVALFIPLGLAIGVAPASRQKATLVLAAFTLPLTIEVTQLLVTPLARACESADVFDNLTGLVVGLSAGAFLARVVRGSSRAGVAEQ